MSSTSASGIQYCNTSDLELAVGGASILVQLLDKDGDGVADIELVASVIGRASSEVSAAIQVQYTLSTLSAPYPDILVYAAANIAAYYAWLQGGSDVVVPENAKSLYEAALRTLDQIAKRERALGLTGAAPGTNQDVKEINVDPTGTGVTRDSLVGFW